MATKPKLDYSKLSDEELQAIANDDYTKLSDSTLNLKAADDAEEKRIEKESKVDKSKSLRDSTTAALVGGGFGAKYVAPVVGTGMAIDYYANKIADRFPKQVPSVTVEAAPSAYNTPHGVGAGAVKNAEHNVGEVLKNKAAQAAINTPGYVSPGNSTILMPEGVAAAEEAAQVAKAAPSKLDKIRSGAAAMGRAITPTGVGGKLLNTALPVASLAGAGFQADDALTRYQHGDTGRAIVSGLGALGSAASLVPHPATRLIGTGVALAAPAINAGIDKLYGREGYSEGGAAHGPDMPTMAR